MKKEILFPRLLLRAFNVFFCNSIAYQLFASFIGFGVSGRVLLTIAAVSAFSVAVLEIRKHQTLCALGCFAVYGVCTAVFWKSVTNGARWIAYHFIALLKLRFSVGIYISKEGCTPADRDILLCLVMSIFCLLLAICLKTRKQLAVWVACTAMVLVAAIGINTFPEPGAIIAYACMLIYLRISVVWEPMESMKVFLYELILLFAVLLFGFGMTKIITKDLHSRSVEDSRVRKMIRQFNEKTVNRISEKISERLTRKNGQPAGMAGGHLSSGRISYTDETHLIVTLPKNSPRTYLRGYVGGEYSYSTWREPAEYSEFVSQYFYTDQIVTNLFADERKYDLSPFYYWEGEVDIDPNILQKTYDVFDACLFEAHPPMAGKSRFPLYRAAMRIQCVGADRDYLYVPYCASDSRGSAAYVTHFTERAWRPLYGNWRDQLFYMIYNEKGVPNYYAIAEDSPWNSLSLYGADERGQVGMLLQYDNYESIRLHRYLRVPETFEEVLMDMLPGEAFRLTTVEQKVAFVQNYMGENFRYTINPPKNEEGIDPLLFFLTESKQGYCMHYTSAAVMIFRLMGVPARYAEGYVLSSKDIAGGTQTTLVKEDAGYVTEVKDAKWSSNGTENIKTEYVTVNVTDRAAHAWVEIWLNDYGWFPIEVTYDFSDSADLGYLNRAIENENRPTVTPSEKPSGTVTPSPTGSINQPTPKQNTEKKKHTAEEESNPFLKIVLILVALFFLTVFGFLLRYYLLTLRRERRFLAKDPNRATVAVYKEIIVLARYFGIKREENEMDREFHERLFRELPDFSEEVSMQNVAKLTEIAVFSETGVTKSDKLTVKRYYRKLRKEYLSKMKQPGRLFKQIYYII